MSLPNEKSSDMETTAPKKVRRPSLPQKVETEIVVRSRRRCCLCVFLENNLSVKKFQIAHIDHDPTNNKPDNLVVLCLEHHDDYDTPRSQSKGITANEIKHWRGELDKIWQQSDEQLQITVNGSGGVENPSGKRFIRPSAHLLGEVLVALDEDMLRSQEGRGWTGRATGIKLARLGRQAIEEEGDLDVALEAFMSLLRLSVAAPISASGSLRMHETQPLLTPPLSTVNLLRIMRQDWAMMLEAAQRAHVYALIEDEPSSSLADYSQIPRKSWRTVVDVLYHDTKERVKNNL